MKQINIAIDGYSSCGKSTLAKALAKALGYTFIDSGAMYRAVTLYAIKKKLIRNSEIDEELLIKSLSHIQIQLNQSNVILNGEDVSLEIRKAYVADAVSHISAIPKVRAFLVSLQQEMGREKGVVMDGRDIGTVVFPKAELKIFMTASMQVRAERRFKELVSKGIKMSFNQVLENLKKRDLIDTTRAADPLKQAEDAILLDNSLISQDEQLKMALKWFEEKANS